MPGTRIADSSHRRVAASLRRDVMRPLPGHRLRGIQQQVQHCRPNQLAVGGDRDVLTIDEISTRRRRIASNHRDRIRQRSSRVRRRRAEAGAARKHHQVVDQLAQARRCGRRCRASPAARHRRRAAATSGPDRTLDAGERIADLVRDHGGHLAHARQRRLLGEPLLRGLARGDVGADRDVLVRLSAPRRGTARSSCRPSSSARPSRGCGSRRARRGRWRWSARDRG